LLAEIPPFEDGDYSEIKFRERYNADLANGLGNLSARVSNLLEKNSIISSLKVDLTEENIKETATRFEKAFDAYRFNECLQIIWEKIKASDEILSRTTPWKMTDKQEIAAVLIPIAQTILNLSYLLEPFIPENAQKIQDCFQAEQIKKIPPLFPRLAIEKL
jgi:methionyl-tRNA synthetase